ncbi:MAG TPA: hypothetical protein VM618_07450 [Acidimicrobiia bacterium]|nr:hypothetical protein [Acidimicrobiia bacterium]
MEGIAARQYGLVSRRQALETLSVAAVSRRVGTGEWTIVLPSVYRLPGVPVTWRQRAMAATLWAGETGVASHTAAAALWGLDGVDRRAVEITTPRRLRAAGVVVHNGDPVPEADRSARHGIPCTSATRTLVDLSAVLDEESFETAMEDAFRRRLTTPARLQWRLEQVGGRGRAGTR